MHLRDTVVQIFRGTAIQAALHTIPRFSGIPKDNYLTYNELSKICRIDIDWEVKQPYKAIAATAIRSKQYIIFASLRGRRSECDS